MYLLKNKPILKKKIIKNLQSKHVLNEIYYSTMVLQVKKKFWKVINSYTVNVLCQDNP